MQLSLWCVHSFAGPLYCFVSECSALKRLPWLGTQQDGVCRLTAIDLWKDYFLNDNMSVGRPRPILHLMALLLVRNVVYFYLAVPKAKLSLRLAIISMRTTRNDSMCRILKW